jgi:hypothetical protein
MRLLDGAHDDQHGLQRDVSAIRCRRCAPRSHQHLGVLVHPPLEGEPQ